MTLILQSIIKMEKIQTSFFACKKYFILYPKDVRKCILFYKYDLYQDKKEYINICIKRVFILLLCIKNYSISPHISKKSFIIDFEIKKSEQNIHMYF